MDNQSESGKISKSLLAFNGLLVVGVVLMTFVIFSVAHGPIAKKVDVPEEKVTVAAFQDVSLLAKSVYIYDLANDEVLFKKNESYQLPLASITKLMMALTAVELFPKDSHITVRKEFLESEGDTGLLANESWKLKDLLDFSLMVSSNDGARSVASVIGAFDLKGTDYDLGRRDFITKMNEKAQEIGLKQTYFINESGLDEDSVSGGYGSASDVASLMKYILKNNPDILEVTKYQTLSIDSSSATHKAVNTNTDVDSIPGLIASKTGYTSLAGGNLAVAFDPGIGRPIIIVVLGSTQEGRFEDMLKLVDATMEYIQGE